MSHPPRPVEAPDTRHDDTLEVAVSTVLSPLVRRILAPNPGPMTGAGTNTYLVGTTDVTVIDPGPDDPTHVGAILDATDRRVGRIVCTHTHVDHWPAADALREATGALIHAFGSRDGLEVDLELRDGDRLRGDDHTLEMIHTPGHASNHLCVLLVEEQMLFSGDHLNQGTTVVIAPPDGDMGAYLASLDRLAAWQPPLKTVAPAHGHLIDDPAEIIRAYTEHRLAREAMVADALGGVGDAVTVDELTAIVYADVNPALFGVARFSLWAHLRKLADDGRAVADDRDDLEHGCWSSA